MRESLPLRRRDWPAYLRSAAAAFRLATSGARDATQVHTHMCYSRFGDILDAIATMDADVLSIETARSKMGLFHDFARFFRDRLGCADALFLDGGSAPGLYDPDLGRDDPPGHGGYGPIIAVVEKKG